MNREGAELVDAARGRRLSRRLSARRRREQPRDVGRASRTIPKRCSHAAQVRSVRGSQLAERPARAR